MSDDAAPAAKTDSHHLQQKQFVNSQEMSDVTFIIGSEKIYAHKYYYLFKYYVYSHCLFTFRVILGMHSRVFQSMLFNGMKESYLSEIELVDVEKDTFILLLEYIILFIYNKYLLWILWDIYGGTVPTNNVELATLVSLLAAADKVRVYSALSLLNPN